MISSIINLWDFCFVWKSWKFKFFFIVILLTSKGRTHCSLNSVKWRACVITANTGLRLYNSGKKQNEWKQKQQRQYRHLGWQTLARGWRQVPASYACSRAVCTRDVSLSASLWRTHAGIPWDLRSFIISYNSLTISLDSLAWVYWIYTNLLSRI